MARIGAFSTLFSVSSLRMPFPAAHAICAR